ncbi:MAG: hypothetical protein ACK5TU_05485 [Cyclobacteriaceae bacterium]|jgi:hypothetical protein
MIIKNRRIINNACVVWQVKEGQDLYRLGANDMHIIAEELEKLEAVSPGKKWVMVVLKSIAALWRSHNS